MILNGLRRSLLCKMKEFPNRLKPENKKKFPQYRYERNLAYMRKEIFELTLLGEENNYFEIDNFARRHNLNPNEIDKMCNTVVKELRNLGWNVKISFGGTGLFVYSTEKPPSCCFDDEF